MRVFNKKSHDRIEMGWAIFIVLCVVLVAITMRNVKEGSKGQRGCGNGSVRYGNVSGGYRGIVRSPWY